MYLLSAYASKKLNNLWDGNLIAKLLASVIWIIVFNYDNAFLYLLEAWITILKPKMHIISFNNIADTDNNRMIKTPKGLFRFAISKSAI